MNPLSWRCAGAGYAAALLCIYAACAPGAWAADGDNWDLGDLYVSPQAWTEAHTKFLAQANSLDAYAATLPRSAADMLDALSAISAVKKESSRLIAYALLKRDENVNIGANQERVQAALALDTALQEKTAWVTPAILKLGAERVLAFEQQSPQLALRFRFLLDNALRYAPHTLGTEAEQVLAAAGSILAQPGFIYGQLADGELPFPTVTLSSGAGVKLDTAAYEKYRQSTNRADRKIVFDAFWHAQGAFQGTFGALLTTRVKGEEFDANVRHFANALADATFADNMPESVYRTLIAEVNKNLPVLHRYLKLRREVLGITDELRYYDTYAPIFELKSPPRFSAELSRKIALEVTGVYGAEYTALLKRGFAGRWMSLYPQPGKASGAYMDAGAYDVHPYLLFNNHDDYESLSTFLHEWGHAVHSLLADKVQPYETANYSTFIAETASTTNEMLLVDYLTAHAGNDAEKLYYLGQGVDLIRGSFFRQSMFAEFQLAIHEEIEQGGTLSGERMSAMYCDLLKKYNGEAQGVMKIDPDYCSEWTFIPHFYGGFYVYQYATSITGAAVFADALEHGGAPARARYLAMLKAGGSEYAYTLYKQAGLDMASADPYEALAGRMNRLLDQIEALRRKALRR